MHNLKLESPLGSDTIVSSSILSDPILRKCINISLEVYSDACHLSSSKFIVKYADKMSPNSPLSVESLYKKIREYIVDNKIPIK